MHLWVAFQFTCRDCHTLFELSIVITPSFLRFLRSFFTLLYTSWVISLSMQEYVELSSSSFFNLSSLSLASRATTRLPLSAGQITTESSRSKSVTADSSLFAKVLLVLGLNVFHCVLRYCLNVPIQPRFPATTRRPVP